MKIPHPQWGFVPLTASLQVAPLWKSTHFHPYIQDQTFEMYSHEEGKNKYEDTEDIITGILANHHYNILLFYLVKFVECLFEFCVEELFH